MELLQCKVSFVLFSSGSLNLIFFLFYHINSIYSTKTKYDTSCHILFDMIRKNYRVDFVRIAIAGVLLKKERWLKNLAEE